MPTALSARLRNISRAGDKVVGRRWLERFYTLVTHLRRRAASHTFYQWIETGAAMGLASGYPCGGPRRDVRLARPALLPLQLQREPGQLAKMLVSRRTGRLSHQAPRRVKDVPAGNAFYGYVERVRLMGSSTATVRQPPASLAPAPTSALRHPPRAPRQARCQPGAGGMVAHTHADPSAASSGACPMFPADNIWNRRVDTLPLHPMSNAYIASIGLEANVHADFGSGLWDGGPIGIPFVKVPVGQPMVNINFTAYGDESDPGPYPVPTSAPVEGGPDADGDRHVLVLQEGTCKLYELYRAFPNPDGSWDADSAAVYDLRSNALRTAGWTSAVPRTALVPRP